VMRGSVLLAQGDRQGALNAWNAMMSGRVTTDDAQAYLKVMADNGFLREALPQLENFIVAFITRPKRRSDDVDRTELLLPLLAEISERADTRTQAAVVSSFESLLNRLPDNLGIGKAIVDNNLLPENAMAGIFRAMHRRYVDIANATFGTPEYDGDYYTGETNVSPARDLSEFRHHFLDYLIRTNSLADARLLVAEIKKNQAEITLVYEDQPKDENSESTPTDYYEWLPLASALLNLRTGGDPAKAIAELRIYCGLDSDKQDSTSGSDESSEETYPQSGMHEHCLKAYALLLAERKDKEAEDLLYEVYKKDSQLRYASEASLAGLAEIEARRGRNDEASRLLKLLVERSTDNLKALRLAAETAAKINRFAEAIDFRQQIATANPDDAANRLELVRVMSAAGRNSEAMDRLIALLQERTTPNSLKAQIAEVAGEIAKADRNTAEKVQSLLQRAGVQDGAGELLAGAAVDENTGNMERAQSLLSRVKGPLESVAQVKLGLINRNAGRDAEAVKNFERAIYLDPDETLTAAIAFRLTSSRAQLITLYSKLQRDQAAVQLTIGEADSKSLLSAAARKALDTPGENASAEAASVFEPSLEITKSKITGLKTIAERNDSASANVQNDLIFALAESSARLGRLDRAIALERLRASEAKRAEDKTNIEKRIESFVAVKLAREKAALALMRINKANATESIYSARVLGN
jgi:hypothetical protein